MLESWLIILYRVNSCVYCLVFLQFPSKMAGVVPFKPPFVGDLNGSAEFGFGLPPPPPPPGSPLGSPPWPPLPGCSWPDSQGGGPPPPNARLWLPSPSCPPPGPIGVVTWYMSTSSLWSSPLIMVEVSMVIVAIFVLLVTLNLKVKASS